MAEARKKCGTQLAKFVRQECANWDKAGGGCLLEGDCRLMAGNACLYFENAVLGSAEGNFRQGDYDFEVIFREYAEINQAFTGAKVKQRKCECGKTLVKGRRYCDKCRKKRNREANRKRQARCRSNVTL